MTIKRAIWNGAVLAESEITETVDGYTYFPPSSVKRECLRPSDTHTRCGWKGTASYHDVVVAGEVNPDAAWYYPSASQAAKSIEGWMAFWHGVKIEGSDRDSPAKQGSAGGASGSCSV